MLILGFYKPLLGLVDNFIHGVNVGQTFLLLISMSLGIAVGFIICSKLMSYLYAKHNQATNYAIFGFVVGSLVGIFINQNMFEYLGILAGGEHVIQIYEWIVGPIAMLVGAAATLTLFYFVNKRKEQEEHA